MTGSHSVGGITSTQEVVGKGANMKVQPYYSIDPTDPDVWHDHDNCPTGQQIPPRNRREGKPATHRRCEHCIGMG